MTLSRTNVFLAIVLVATVLGTHGYACRLFAAQY